MRPLHVAAWLGGIDTVQALLSAGASVDAPDSLGEPPLFAALRAGAAGVPAVVALLAGGASATAAAGPGASTALHVAAASGSGAGKLGLHVAGLLLRAAGASALPAAVEARDSKGRTPLHVAAEAGNVDLVSLLLSEGASATARDGIGRTPRTCAEDAKEFNVVKVFNDHLDGEDDGPMPPPYADIATECLDVGAVNPQGRNII
ncbi:hypothetical protein HK405_013743 [Cladochytrium tenue]|nr:hypothetical protein HK405_013743 [Cladochytrium tenue]